MNKEEKDKLHEEAIGLILTGNPIHNKRIREINTLVGIENEANWEGLVEYIRDNVDPIDYIGKFIDVRDRYRDGKALCPFHEDTSPSLSISRDRKMWKCFSCPNTNGGDVIKFTEHYQRLSWMDSVKFICKMYNIDWKEKLNE